MPRSLNKTMRRNTLRYYALRLAVLTCIGQKRLVISRHHPT